MIKVGFTGTREGLTEQQLKSLEIVLVGEAGRGQLELHHGDCVGADKAAHDLATSHGWLRVVHPPLSWSLRAFCQGDETLPLKPYLERNRDIVDATEVLVACPKEAQRSRGGGTWHTVWYAASSGREVVVVYPCGRVERGAQ